MRKLFALLMLLVFLFNLLGYQIFYHYMMKEAGLEMEEKADKSQLAESGFTEIKIKLNLPYIKDWSSYERYDGELELNGVYYNYVKRRVYHDTLFLVCVRNDKKIDLATQKEAYQSRTNDVQNNQGTKEIAIKKSPFVPDYRQLPDEYLFSVLDNTLTQTHSTKESPLLHPFVASRERPPQA